MPTLSRIRSAGTSSWVPATDAWVILPGCSISDSTPPRDSPRMITLVRAHTSSAAASPPATRKLTMPPKRRICRLARSWPGWLARPGKNTSVDPRMLGQERRHLLGVVAVPVHPHRQGAQPAQHQPGVERAGHAADRVLVEAQPLGQVVVVDHQRAADDVGVAAAVLGGGVHDHVGAEGDRLLQVRAGEGVVHDDQGAGRVGQLGDGGDVGDGQQRVGRRLDPDPGGHARE